MARFDVYAFSSKRTPLVLDVQADLLEDLASRVVVPLVPVSKGRSEVLPRLKPVIAVYKKRYVMMTTDLASLPVHRLGAKVAEVDEAERDDVVNALDFLLRGF